MNKGKKLVLKFEKNFIALRNKTELNIYILVRQKLIYEKNLEIITNWYQKIGSRNLNTILGNEEPI